MEGVRFTQVVAAQPEGADGCLVRFSDINDAEMAQQLVGCTVLLEGDPPEGAQQDDALEVLRGFEVVDEVLGPVGVVESVDAGPDRFQPLMHVRRSHSAEDALIPLVEDLIVRIDEQEERIHMRLPSGLLDI